MGKNKVLGLIPARGGSKGIPGKNIRDLCGKPLIAHTIEESLKAKSLDRVIVSTDNQEIALIAQEFGAQIPFLRPSKYAQDTSSTISVVHHALKWLKDNEHYEVDAIAILTPTCPLRTASQIDNTVNILWESGLDSAVTILPPKHHPYFIYSLKKDQNYPQLEELITLANKPMRRQDLPVFYTHTQSVIVSKIDYLKTTNDSSSCLNFQSLTGFEIDEASALDIDEIYDFYLAELLIKDRLKKIKP